MIISGSDDKTAQMWDVETGHRIGKPLPLLGRSAEFCLSRTDLPTFDVTEPTNPEGDDPEDNDEVHDCGDDVPSVSSGFCPPGNGMLEEELGRTGECFSMPAK